MNLGVNISDKEIKSAINKLIQLKNELSKEVDMEIASAGEDIVRLSKQKAPAFIAGQIYLNKKDFLKYSVKSDFIYSAYFEFGTGKYYLEYKSELTSEWQSIAADYFVNGKGRLDRKPYLYPSFNEVRPKLFKTIIDLIKEKN